MTDAPDPRVRHLLDLLTAQRFDGPGIDAFAAHVEAMRREMDPDSRIRLADRLWREVPPRDTVRFHSVLFALTGDLWHYERILHYLLFAIDDIDPAQLHYVLWCMQRQLFLGAADPAKAGAFFCCDVMRFYDAMVRTLARRWAIAPARRAPAPAAIRRVAVVTNQFTSDRHQPSRDCFDFARLLLDEFGLDVAIINANLMPLRVANLFMPPMVADVVERYEGVVAIEMFGRRIKMASFTGRAFDRDKVATIVDSTVGFDPDVVVAFGGSNIVADLIAHARSRPVVCLPTTSGLTLSLADVVLGYDGGDPTAGIPAPYREPFARRFRPFSFGWTPPPLDPSAPAVPLPADAFVFAVVGTRLDNEVDASFVALVEEVLDRCPGAVAAFAGPATRLPALLAQSRLAGRMLATGHVADIRAFYRRCGAYLNPPRQGGGGSAAFALAEGLPVVTLPVGDVASVAGPEAHVPDRAAFVATAVRLFADAGHRADSGRRAAERFATVHDRRRSVVRLMEHCREACDLFAAAGGN